MTQSHQRLADGAAGVANARREFHRALASPEMMDLAGGVLRQDGDRTVLFPLPAAVVVATPDTLVLRVDQDVLPEVIATNNGSQQLRFLL